MMATENAGSLYAPLPKNPFVFGGVAIEHRVPARDEGRVLLEVDVIPSNGVSVAGQYVAPGTHRVIVYATEVPAVEAMVRTPEEETEWNRSVAKHEAAMERTLVEAKLSIKDVAKDPDLASARRKAIASYGATSSEAILAQTFRTGIGVLRSCKVLDADVPPPETDVVRERKRSEEMAEMMAMRETALVGNPVQAADKLRILAKQLELDELVVCSWTHDPAVQLRSFELLAKAMGLVP
jgi:hypothetical protein